MHRSVIVSKCRAVTTHVQRRVAVNASGRCDQVAATRPFYSATPRNKQSQGREIPKDAEPDKDSIQACMIKKLQYIATPAPPPPRPSSPSFRQFRTAPPPTVSTCQCRSLSTSEASSQKSISTVVVESLAESQATGATQAAALTPSPQDITPQAQQRSNSSPPTEDPQATSSPCFGK